MESSLEFFDGGAFVPSLHAASLDEVGEGGVAAVVEGVLSERHVKEALISVAGAC